MQMLNRLKMNEIVNKFSLAGDKFMPEMHLKQPGFTYSDYGPFTKNKERIQKFKKTGDTSYIYKNELDKNCFQHVMAYGDFKDLARRTASGKVLILIWVGGGGVILPLSWFSLNNSRTVKAVTLDVCSIQ